MTRDEALIRAALEMAAGMIEESAKDAMEAADTSDMGSIVATWLNDEAEAIRAINPAEVLAKVEAVEADAIQMTYRNYRGEVSRRTISPISIWFGTTDWHPEPGWLLSGIDMDKGERRDFALADCQFADLSPAPDAVARLIEESDNLLPAFLATAARNIDFDGPWDDFDLAGGLRSALAEIERLDRADRAAMEASHG